VGVPLDVISVRRHLSVSLLPLSSPTLHLFICIPPPHLCTSSKDHTSSQRLPGLIVQRLPRSRLTNSRQLPVSHSAHTWATSDEPRTSLGRIGTGPRDATAPSTIMWMTIYGRLGTRRLGTAFLCILL
jgi:hypothetical protein